MLSINKVMITGRLTRDPETRYIPSGTAVTMLGVAVNRRFLDKNNEWRDETAFLDVEVWGKLAERCAESLKKGRPVYIEGRLKQDSWEKDGQKQTKLRISADRVTAFEVPARGGDTTDMSGEYGDTGASNQGSGPRPAQKAERPATGAPSDGLDFSSEPGVQDDIPF